MTRTLGPLDLLVVAGTPRNSQARGSAYITALVTRSSGKRAAKYRIG